MAFIPNPPTPFVGPINGVSDGFIVSISGQPRPQAHRFAVNLQCGGNINPRDDIALHINPRFEGPNSLVMRNSLQRGQWGSEESFGHFPFREGQPFEMIILVESDMFKIAINGEHYTEFRHRLPMQRVNTLAIDGDVTIYMIRYEGGMAGIPADPSGEVLQQMQMQPTFDAQQKQYGQKLPPSPLPGEAFSNSSSSAPYPNQQVGFGGGVGSGAYVPSPTVEPGYGASQGWYGHGGAPPPYPTTEKYSSGMATNYSASGSHSQAPYPTQSQHSQGYGAQSGQMNAYPAQSQHTQGSGAQGGQSSGFFQKSDFLKMGGSAALGAIGGFAAGRLMYPGKGKKGQGYGHGGMMSGGGGGGGMGGMMHGMMGKKMKKQKHGFGPKMKKAKGFKGKKNKGWHKKGSSSSSSSSSSSEEE